MAILNSIILFYLSRYRWLSVITGLSIFTSTLGLLFKFLRWNESNEMLIVSIPFWLFFILAFIIRKKLFHKLFVKIALVYGVCFLFINSSYLVFGLTFSPLNLCKLIYQHETLNIEPFIELRQQMFFKEGPNWEKVSEGEIKRSINVLEKYAKKYGTRFGFTEVYNYGLGYYGLFAEETAMDQRKRADSISLAKVYLVILEARKISEMFDYKYHPLYEETREVLEQMGKKEELLNYYNDILSHSPDEYFKEIVRADLDSFQKKEKVNP